jgi:hypothetical protein
LKIGSLIATLTITLAALSTTRPVTSQEPQGFITGTPLGVAVEGEFRPMSSNVKVYGAVVNAECCSYDPVRDLIVVVNRGAGAAPREPRILTIPGASVPGAAPARRRSGVRRSYR